MSDQARRAARRPWWVLGGGVGSSIALTALFLAMVGWRITQFVADQQVLDGVFVAAGLLLVVAGIVSIVYYLRKDDR